MSLEYIFYTYLTYNSYMINGYLYREASTSGADGLEFQYIGYNCNYLNRTGNSRNNIQWKSLNGSFPISIKVLKRTGSGRTDIKYESMTVPFNLTPTTRDCEPNCMFIGVYSTEKAEGLYNYFSYNYYRNSFRTLPNIYNNTDNPWFYTYCNNGNIINLTDPITRYIVGKSLTTYPEIHLHFGVQTEGGEYVRWACKTNSLFQKVKKIKLSNSVTYTVEYKAYLSSAVQYIIKSPTSVTSSNIPSSISKIELLAS